MADTPKTVRVDDALWAAAVAKSETEGTSVSEIVRDGLRQYVGGSAVTDADRELVAAFREASAAMNEFGEAEKRRRARMVRATAGVFRNAAKAITLVEG
jgi:hypothetical protein